MPLCKNVPIDHPVILESYKVMRFPLSFCTNRKVDIFCMFLIFAKQGKNHFYNAPGKNFEISRTFENEQNIKGTFLHWVLITGNLHGKVD